VTVYRDQVVQALRAVRVASPTSYAWFGRLSRPLPRTLSQALAPEERRAYLIDRLEDELYRSFYTQGKPVPLAPSGVGLDRPDDAFVEELSRANNGSGGWAGGWTVIGQHPPYLLLTRNGLQARVPASDCRSSDCGRGEATASVRRPKELRTATPGFYTALGDRQPSFSDGDVEVRLYFHVRATGARVLVAAATRVLNEAEIPFTLKVVDRPGGFARCDAAVLYLDRPGFDHAHQLLAGIAAECAPFLDQARPGFTKSLSRGVAIGEHRRSHGGSFGSSRCRLMAEGLAIAHEQGKARLRDRVAAVAQRFADAGLDVEAPYLADPSGRDNAF
jgi:HopA1 effector protein family